MTIKEFLRTVIDVGRVKVTGLTGSSNVRACIPTTPHLGYLFPIGIGDTLIRPHRMDGRVLVDMEGADDMYRLEIP